MPAAQAMSLHARAYAESIDPGALSGKIGGT
jgi:hypothetical protein